MSDNLQAVILAGGLGTRLRPLTECVPKPMVIVAGAPYLEHQVRILEKQRITDLLLLTGYLGEQIEAHFGDGGKFGVSLRYSREQTPLGTAGALRQASALLAESFLVIYGDSLLPIRYAGVLQTLEHSDAKGALVVYDNRLGDTSVPNNVALDDEGRIVRYEKRAGVDSALSHVEAGVLAFRRSIVAHIPEGFVSLEEDLFPGCIARRQLVAHRTCQRFFDMGTPERLRVIERFLYDYYSDTFSH